SPRLHQSGRLRDGGLQRGRLLADQGAIDGLADRHHVGRRHRRPDGAHHRAGRSDEQGGRLEDGATPVRAAADLVPVRARRRPQRLRNRQPAGRQDRAGRLHDSEPGHGFDPNCPVSNPSRGSDAMNRRVFLKGVGGVSLAAPFLRSVFEKAAKAQGTTVTTPKRLVIHFTHNGCLTDRWWPKVSTYTNGAATLTADMLKGQTLEPLTPYISKITVPRGFRSMNQYGSGQSIDPHDQAMGSKLTCATIGTDSKRYATAASLDHVIAKQINPGGAAPLVLSVGAASTS